MKRKLREGSGGWREQSKGWKGNLMLNENEYQEYVEPLSPGYLSKCIKHKIYGFICINY